MPKSVIFMHYGNSSYLGHSLSQAKKSNPNTDVILLGDDSNNNYSFVNHIKINLGKSVEEFNKVYKHMSSNPYEYEIFCIQRWFILRDFMSQYNMNQCYYQDSDVMLYTDVNKEAFSHFDLSFFGGFSGHTTFINNVNALDDFCTFIMKCYTDKSRLSRLENIYQGLLEKHLPGGICDMTLIDHYCQQSQYTICNLEKVVDDTTFDHNINVVQDYEHWFGRKKIYRTNSGIFCKNIPLNRYVMFYSLHFQGDTKIFMKHFAAELPEGYDELFTFDYSSCRWMKADGW